MTTNRGSPQRPNYLDSTRSRDIALSIDRIIHCTFPPRNRQKGHDRVRHRWQQLGRRPAIPLCCVFHSLARSATSFHKPSPFWRLMQTTRALEVIRFPVVPVQRDSISPNNVTNVRDRKLRGPGAGISTQAAGEDSWSSLLAVPSGSTKSRPVVGPPDGSASETEDQKQN